MHRVGLRCSARPGPDVLPFTLELSALLPEHRPSKPMFSDPPTGFGMPGCFLAGTGDCAGPLIDEHYISRAVLKQFQGLAIRGAKWQAGSAAWKPIGINSLTSKVLCERHSGVLGPQLDTLAGRVFSAIRGDASASFDGLLLERWFLKATLGAIAGQGVGGRTKANAVVQSGA